eukprot:jgi/Chrpa1/14867/Chrysochromulina_OHIO_Genome00003861-RA
MADAIDKKAKRAKKEEHKKEKKHKKEKHKKHHDESKKKKKHKRKRESSSSVSESSSSESSGLGRRELPRSTTSFVSCADLYPMPKRRAFGNVSLSISSSEPLTASEVERRAERTDRFQATAADVALAEHRAAELAAARANPRRPGDALRGQSQALEKAYTRLTSMPVASDVRPLPVLRQALELVQRRWAVERDYAYAREQLKAIRQDLTVQHLGADGARSALAVQVYETHARLALRSDDLDELSACLEALVPLHAAGAHYGAIRTTNAARAEFGAYRMLYAGVHRPAALGSELGGIVCGWDAAVRDDPAILQAWRVILAWQRGDWGGVLAEWPRMANEGAGLLRPKLPLLRERALRLLCRAYAPSLPMSFLCRGLGWGPDQAAECEAWLRSEGVVPAHVSGRPERELETRAALRTLEQRAALRAAEERTDDRWAAEKLGLFGPSAPN